MLFAHNDVTLFNLKELKKNSHKYLKMQKNPKNDGLL